MDKYTKEPIDWDSYKELIWVWYMVDNESLSDILELLKQKDVVATKQQLEFRLKKWRIFKTIKSQEARWMANQLDISQKAGEPVIFVKSGKILPESQVAQAVKRHAPLPTFAQKFNTGELYTFVVALASKSLVLGPLISATDSDASHSLNTTDLIACSPGPPGLHAREIKPWGLNSMLPWIRFRCALLDGSVRIQVRGDARTSMPPDHLLPIIFAYRLPSNSGLGVCKLATNLGQVMPEVYTGEHIRRICAIAQAQSSLTIDPLQVLIFQLSNNFLGYDGDFNFEHIVHLMRAFGLDNPTTIRFLFEAAADQPTILAVLDKFWKAAYATSSTKIASIIFTEFVRRYDGKNTFRLEIIRALEHAIDTEDLDLAKVLLSGPKSSRVTEILLYKCTDFLERCSVARNHEFALAMASLLLERHDQRLKITDSHLISFALNSGNIRLARFLVEAGLSLLHHSDDWPFRLVTYSLPAGRCSRDRRSIIDRETIFTAAVIPHDMRNDTNLIGFEKWQKKNRFANRAEAEKMVLKNYLGLSEMLSEIGRLPEWLEGASSSTQSPDLDVVVLAALYGYDALLQTFVHSPSSLNQHNSNGLWPLSAAALGDNVSTCRLLVRLGADPNYIPPFGDWPAPLHHAVYHNSTPLVELLLDIGADINLQSKIRHRDHPRCLGLDKHTCPISALALAISLPRWETAFLLVHRGAEIDPLAIDLAVRRGESTLIDLMLSRESFQWPPDRCCITEKNDGSAVRIVPVNSNAANCGELIGPQAQQTTHDILSRAVLSGSLSLVSRTLKMKTTGSEHHSLQDALTCSFEKGFEKISHELIRDGAKMTQYDLALSFRACTLISIHEFITNSRGPPLWTIERGLQGFALELAILDNTLDVVQFALDAFPQAYSSGALSAAVLRAAKSDFRGSRELTNELILRRANAGSELLDPILENTALAIAILLQAPAEVIESLLQRTWPGMPAIGCRDHFENRLSGDIAKFYHKILAKIFMAEQSRQNVSPVQYFRYDVDKLKWWCTKPLQHERVMPNLPLTLAISLCNDHVYEKLMAKGFLAGLRTIEAVIKRCTSLDVLEGVLGSCKEGHHIIRLTDDILHFALIYKNDQAMRYLINNGAKMSAKEDPKPGQFVTTVLQSAVYKCRSLDDRRFVQLLLDAGADVNEAPDYEAFTALQAAAENGQLDLVRQLVSLGADINARRALYDGLTCLEAAAQKGRLDVTQFLLDAGATTAGRGQLQYIRAAKMAQRSGHAAVAQILRKHRPWDESDESLFEEGFIVMPFVLHPTEYTVEEIRDLADKICAENHADWEYIWPEIDDHSEADKTDFSDDGADDHHSLDVDEVVPPSEDPIVASTSQLAFDVLNDRSPGTYGSTTDPSSSQMVVSNPPSNYNMPLHTSFTQIQADPDFHERIYEVEGD